MGRDNQPLDVKDAGRRPSSERPKAAAESAPVEVPQAAIDSITQTGRAAAKEVLDAEQQRLANEAKQEAKDFNGKRRWSAVTAGMYGAGLGIIGAAAATFLPVTAAFGGVALLAAGASTGALIGSTMGYTLTGLDPQKLDSQISADNSRVGEAMWKAFETAVSQQIGVESSKHEGKANYADIERAFYQDLSAKLPNVDTAREKFGFTITSDFLDRLAFKNHSLKPAEEQNQHLTYMEPPPNPPVDIAREESAPATRPAIQRGATLPSPGEYTHRDIDMAPETRGKIKEADQEFQKSIEDGPSLRGTHTAASVQRDLSRMIE